MKILIFVVLEIDLRSGLNAWKIRNDSILRGRLKKCF